MHPRELINRFDELCKIIHGANLRLYVPFVGQFCCGHEPDSAISFERRVLLSLQLLRFACGASIEAFFIIEDHLARPWRKAF